MMLNNLLNKEELNNKIHTLFPDIENLFYIIIIAAWFTIAFLTGLHHEPWADEAQSWLIARDNSISSLIFKVLKYEGTPVLWYLQLKFAQFLHLPYKYIFLIPLINTGIGLYLLIFKSKLPNYIKCLFPFTFFIIYQYAVVARNYSLFLPILAFIAITYKKRLEKPFLYGFLLILLLSVSAQAYVLSVMLLILFIYDNIKSHNYNIKFFTATTIVAISALLTFLYLIKPADCTFAASIEFPALLSYINTLTDGYFNIKSISMPVLATVAVISMYACGFILFSKNAGQIIRSVLINACMIAVLTCLYCNYWHCGYVILTFIFTLWILTEENENEIEIESKNKIVKNSFIVLFLSLAMIQIVWAFNCCYFDIHKSYSGSYNAYNYIVKNNLEQYDITGLGFRTIALQPYFKHNIYKNFDKSYWEWRTGALINMHERANDLTPVIVVDVNEAQKYADIIFQLKEYYVRVFEGSLCAKGSLKENTGIIVLVKKGVL